MEGIHDSHALIFQDVPSIVRAARRQGLREGQNETEELVQQLKRAIKKQSGGRNADTLKVLRAAEELEKQNKALDAENRVLPSPNFRDSPLSSSEPALKAHPPDSKGWAISRP